MRDFRVWWVLFVFFAGLSVVVIQRGYRRWRTARHLLAGVDPRARAEVNRRIRLEGWRLVLMTVSLLAMSGVVVTVFWPGRARGAAAESVAPAWLNRAARVTLHPTPIQPGPSCRLNEIKRPKPSF